MMQIKKVAFISTATLLTAGLAWLLAQFSGPAAHWQQSLYQARYSLLAWRLTLYTGLAVSGYILTPRLRQQYPAQYHRLQKTAFWSLVLLALCEISNLLQGAHA
ncbi:hypothetical protein ODD08_004548 [Salmonella enterica]|nr:hypothetical protein [Salmonella enterica subsp. enterica]EDS7122127.1 hypothetical protein [Salmonella enterica subsp. enterica]EEJ8591577.1 hypothetical protein [Salmonella enterica subsp. enterica]EJX0634436.1 hypothetical protein [Salmonella enterica]